MAHTLGQLDVLVRQLQQRVAALGDGAGPPAPDPLPSWTPITNAMLNTDGAGQGWQINSFPLPGVYKRDGRVYWTGLLELALNSPTPATEGTTGLNFGNVFLNTIPAGFWPSRLQRFWVNKDVGGGDGPPRRFEVYIDFHGRMYFDDQHVNGATYSNGCDVLPTVTGGNITVSLETISYRLDAI